MNTFCINFSRSSCVECTTWEPCNFQQSVPLSIRFFLLRINVEKLEVNRFSIVHRVRCTQCRSVVAGQRHKIRANTHCVYSVFVRLHNCIRTPCDVFNHAMHLLKFPPDNRFSNGPFEYTFKFTYILINHASFNRFHILPVFGLRFAKMVANTLLLH